MKTEVHGISLKQTHCKDDFWSPYQKLVVDTVIPYQEKILNDEVPGAEKSHALANFRIAAGMEKGGFYGMVFQDSDVAKWLEAAAYSLWVHPDPVLEQRADEIIEIIAKAQQEDGYLDTYFTIKEPEHRWQNLLEGHELYCMGHMMEAACGYYEVTGKEKLLHVAEKMADHISAVFNEEHYGIPGHEEIETGLMRLYQATGKEKYCRLASYFIENRGRQTDFFRKEKEKRDFSIFDMDPDYLEYNQSHAPVREQKSAEGHAVRAVYLYRAMADLAKATKDESLKKACETLMDNILQKKMYLTGAIGSSGEWEAFSKEYDLPPDRAYAETCAQIGLVFFAKAMLDMEPDGKYADIMERCLYNSTISGMQLDGKHFFYVNPLEVNPGLSGEVFGMRHVLPERPGWYACACCPPNLARMILSLGRLCWSEGEDAIYAHLMIGQEAELGLADIKVETKYPWKGETSYTVMPKTGEPFALAVHIPSYVGENALKVTVNGKAEAYEKKNGYIYLKRQWSAGDILALSFPMEIRRMYSNIRCIDNAGCVALMRGPFVYCFEGADNGRQLQALLLPRDSAIEEVWEKEGVLAGTVTLTMDGVREKDTEELYSCTPPRQEPAKLKAVPYYIWGNREKGQMRVWIRE